MATMTDIKVAVNTAPAQLVKGDRLETMVARLDVKKRFEEILGKKAPAFISSIISATKTNPLLKAADPSSVLSSAVVAATLDLPINQNLGFAAIVPYGGKAQFQMMWRGFVQLAIRTGQYKTMHTSEVYADELEQWNPITGELRLTPQQNWKDRYEGNAKPVGYAAYFKLISGFEKYLYMTTEEVMRHGKKYSKTYQRGMGQWVENFDAMALKTAIKLLLSKYGILSVEMQKAIQADQAVVKEEGREQTFEHEDSADLPGDAQEPIDVPEIKDGQK